MVSFHRFDPCAYAGYLADPGAEAYTKRTCLWTGGGFIMPPLRAVIPIKRNFIRDIPKGPLRADMRAVTPMGFAHAVYQANAPCAVGRSPATS